jgi:hypothetical protein
MSFREAYCLHHQGALMVEAVSSSEMLVNIYQTIQCNIPEDSHLHIHHCENLSSHQFLSHHQGNHGNDKYDDNKGNNGIEGQWQQCDPRSMH